MKPPISRHPLFLWQKLLVPPRKPGPARLSIKAQMGAGAGLVLVTGAGGWGGSRARRPEASEAAGGHRPLLLLLARQAAPPRAWEGPPHPRAAPAGSLRALPRQRGCLVSAHVLAVSSSSWLQLHAEVGGPLSGHRTPCGCQPCTRQSPPGQSLKDPVPVTAPKSHQKPGELLSRSQ